MREKIKLQNPSSYRLIFFAKLNKLFVRSFIDFQNHLTIKKQLSFELDLDEFKQNYREVFTKINNFLDLKSSIPNPTLSKLGYKYSGNFNDKNLNLGKFMEVSSKKLIIIENYESFYIQIFFRLKRKKQINF